MFFTQRHSDATSFFRCESCAAACPNEFIQAGGHQKSAFPVKDQNLVGHHPGNITFKFYFTFENGNITD